jgi:membrane-bound inhibitor of C-type lysozyme
MATCLRGKREAERTYSDTVSYKCIKTQAEIEINKDGSKSIKKIILK